MTWGFQLMIRLPTRHLVNGENNQTWSLPTPVGDVTLVIENETPAQPTELTFRGGGFGSPPEAHAAGKLLSDWLRLAGALDRWGFDFGRDNALSGLGETVKPVAAALLKLADAFLVPDVFGLTTYEQEGAQPRRFSMRAQPSIGRSSDSLLEAVIRAADIRGLTDRVSLACDLVSLAEREGSDRARLLTLATAMEVLADRTGRTGLARELVDKFLSEVEAARTGTDVPLELDSLSSGLGELKQSSISASVRHLARVARPLDQDAAADIASRGYKCRSKLTHDGKSETDLTAVCAELLPLVQDMIRTSL